MERTDKTLLKTVAKVEVNTGLAASGNGGLQVQPVPAPAQAMLWLQKEPRIVVTGQEAAILSGLTVFRNDRRVLVRKVDAEIAKIAMVSSRALPDSRDAGSGPVSQPLPAPPKVAEDQGSSPDIASS